MDLQEQQRLRAKVRVPLTNRIIQYVLIFHIYILDLIFKINLTNSNYESDVIRISLVLIVLYLDINMIRRDCLLFNSTYMIILAPTTL